MADLAQEVVASTRDAQRAAADCARHVRDILEGAPQLKGSINFDYRDIPSRSEFDITQDQRGATAIKISIYQLPDGVTTGGEQPILRVHLDVQLSPDAQRLQIRELKSTKDGELVDDSSFRRDPSHEVFDALSYQLNTIANGLRGQQDMGLLSVPPRE